MDGSGITSEGSRLFDRCQAGLRYCNGSLLGQLADNRAYAIKEKIEREITFPPGYSVVYGGQFENQERATRRLVLVVPLTVAIIFALLYTMFQSVKQSVLVLANIPFSLVGGIAALWLRGLNLNLSASVGFIALFGVAVLNGVVLVNSINQLRNEGQSVAMRL